MQEQTLQACFVASDMHVKSAKVLMYYWLWMSFIFIPAYVFINLNLITVFEGQNGHVYLPV